MDASVGFLLENLKMLLVHQADLIVHFKDDLEGLTKELKEFKAILDEASRKSKKDTIFLGREAQIREAVYDMEDTIERCITKASATKNKGWLQKKFAGLRVGDLAEEIRNLRTKVTPLKAQLKEEFTIADKPETTVGDQARNIRGPPKSKLIVGLEEETKLFVDLLIGKSDKLEITSIIGMAGLGKSTLAWKIFEDDTIRHEFNIRIWVNVSDTLNMKQVLQDIMFELTGNKPDASVPNEVLIRQVHSHLTGNKFFIVMDDVWSINAWKVLKDLLPPDNDEWGRVLITTRHTDVGNNSSEGMLHAHSLRFLTLDESWQLLQYQVFGSRGDVHEELQSLGKNIAKDCKGLPLSIVIIGGILNEKTSAARGNIAKEAVWRKVAKRMKNYLTGEDDVLKSIISLSYNKLPCELKNCFLYLGVFPEDAKIPAKKVIRLWISEGFIPESSDMSLEEVAWDYLNRLINRNLVMVMEEKYDGVPKVCQIHDTVREICKKEGDDLNLFHEICGGRLPENPEKYRRLSIHSDANLHFFSKKPKFHKARSFFSSKESAALKDTDIPSITNAFDLLRVYDAKDMKFPKFPAKFFQQLIHLRYLTLAMASKFETLPEAVTNLWNLRTLIVDTPSKTLEVQGDMWKMWHLRHFETQASINLKKKARGNDAGGEKLQTLCRLSPESTDEVCIKATNLITLEIQGDLKILEDSKCFGGLGSLAKLKLVHQASRSTDDNQLQRLPDSHSFPESLETLVLRGTRLDWSIMSTLSDIVQLKVLKLKENAFQGHTWEVSGKSFGDLLLLQIDWAADLEHWEDSNDHFPKLRCLEIKNCEKLQEFPLTLGKKLEVLTMERVTPAAIECAEKIKAEQEKQKRVVKLNIAAADRISCLHAGNEQVL